LAAILAHEIAHASARQGTVQLSRQVLVQDPTSIVAAMPTREGWKDRLTRLGISFGARASFLRYTHQQELEANTIALQLLSKAGYSPYALSSILHKINARRAEKTTLLSYAYGHPLGEEATMQLEKDLETQTLAANPLRSTPAFRSFHAALLKIPLPVHEPEALTPEPALANLYVHPENYYRLGFPEGWQVTSQPPNGAYIAPRGGIQNSRLGDDINTGVLFDLFPVETQPVSLEQATDRLLVHLRQRNQSLRVIPGATTQVLMGSEPALRIVMIGRSSSTQSTELVWVVTRPYYESLFYIVCVAPEGEEFEKAQPVFEQIIRSIELR
jgi:hypothetical protein